MGIFTREPLNPREDFTMHEPKLAPRMNGRSSGNDPVWETPPKLAPCAVPAEFHAALAAFGQPVAEVSAIHRSKLGIEWQALSPSGVYLITENGGPGREPNEPNGLADSPLRLWWLVPPTMPDGSPHPRLGLPVWEE